MSDSDGPPPLVSDSDSGPARPESDTETDTESDTAAEMRWLYLVAKAVAQAISMGSMRRDSAMKKGKDQGKGDGKAKGMTKGKGDGKAKGMTKRKGDEKAPCSTS